MISAKRTVVIGGLLAIVIIGWYFGVHRFADMDRCFDTGGRWVNGINKCECAAGKLPDPEFSWCSPTLNTDVQRAEKIVRGRCIALERGPNDSYGAKTGSMTIEITETITGTEGSPGESVNVAFIGGPDRGEICSDNSEIIVIYGVAEPDYSLEISYEFEYYFPLYTDIVTGELLVNLDYHHGFTLFDLDSGQPYSPSWDRVPYSDFIYSIERISSVSKPDNS